MKLGVLKEIQDPRVALVPTTIKKYQDLGLEILVEHGAGNESYFPDEEYKDISFVDRPVVLSQSDIILAISPPLDHELKTIQDKAILVGIYGQHKAYQSLSQYAFKVFSLDMIPRISLAQSMDVLSSMASLAGYRAVLLSATSIPRYFPMLTTAAGTIRPAKVLVLGAGVAGLQAIATAKRLGAIVEAFDVRKAAKEEVESLGGKFIEVEGAQDDTHAGGYAVQQSEAFLKRQRDEVQKRSILSDVIITTAQVRGGKAPILVPATTVNKMKKGAVIVDLAAASGGNCELTINNKTINHNGVTIIGDSHLANGMAQDASTLLSNNFLNF